MHPHLSALLLLTAITALPPSAHASNMGFLEFSPSAYFTEQDWALAREAANKLLEEQGDGESITWENKANGHNGKLTVLKTFHDFGTTCRAMEVHNDAIQVQATHVVNMCRNKEGVWKILN